MSKASPAVVETWRLPPSSVGSPARIPVSLASNTRAFFAGLFGWTYPHEGELPGYTFVDTGVPDSLYTAISLTVFRGKVDQSPHG